MKSVHEGHRARLRRAFLSGAELEDHELLELLLTYAIPRADVNPLAHHLLDRFGGLEKVFQASSEELKELAGVGESAAVLIKTVQALQKRLLVRYYTAGSRRRVLFLWRKPVPLRWLFHWRIIMKLCILSVWTVKGRCCAQRLWP